MPFQFSRSSRDRVFGHACHRAPNILVANDNCPAGNAKRFPLTRNKRDQPNAWILQQALEGIDAAVSAPIRNCKGRIVKTPHESRAIPPWAMDQGRSEKGVVRQWPAHVRRQVSCLKAKQIRNHNRPRLRRVHTATPMTRCATAMIQASVDDLLCQASATCRSPSPRSGRNVTDHGSETLVTCPWKTELRRF
jgi:hypothetical protein